MTQALIISAVKKQQSRSCWDRKLFSLSLPPNYRSGTYWWVIINFPSGHLLIIVWDSGTWCETVGNSNNMLWTIFFHYMIPNLPAHLFLIWLSVIVIVSWSIGVYFMNHLPATHSHTRWMLKTSNST